MQIFERRNDENYRRTPACGYCRQQGHNKYQCPRVAEDWYYLKDHIIPIQFTKLVSSWMKQPRYWGEWYTSCGQIFREQERRKEPSISKASRTRAPSKCGFCREECHSRRNCPEQVAFLAKCYKANENWRRAAYKEIVTKHGICVGACIEVAKKDGYGSNSLIVSGIGLITSVNFDKLNVLAAKGGYYNGQGNPYYCPLTVMAMVDGKESEIKLRISSQSRHGNEGYAAIELDHNIVLRSSAGYYASWTMTKLMSPSEHPLDEKWVTDYRDAFDFLTKKKSKEKLDDDGITSLIEKWAKKD